MVNGQVMQEKSEQRKHHDKDSNRDESAHKTFSFSEVDVFLSGTLAFAWLCTLHHAV
jgi:hypothetical protein